MRKESEPIFSKEKKSSERFLASVSDETDEAFYCTFSLFSIFYSDFKGKHYLCAVKRRTPSNTVISKNHHKV